MSDDCLIGRIVCFILGAYHVVIMYWSHSFVDQGYTIEKFKIYFRKFYGRYNDLVQYSPFAICVWPIVDVCHIPRTCPHRIWLIIPLVPPRVSGHSSRSILFLGTYSYTWVFPSVRVVLGATFIPGFVMIMD